MDVNDIQKSESKRNDISSMLHWFLLHLAAVLFLPPDDRASLTPPLLVPLNETFVTMEPFTCKCLLPTDISSSLFHHRYQPTSVSPPLLFLLPLFYFSLPFLYTYIYIYTHPPLLFPSTVFVEHLLRFAYKSFGN